MTDLSRIFVATLALTFTAACGQSAVPSPAGAPAPAAVTCADAPQLRQRADDERIQITETTSDQAKVVGGSRASFYMSLAIVADLKCKVPSDDAEAMLTLALSAARNAEGAANFYEAAVRWSEANVAASRAVAKFMEQLAAATDPMLLTPEMAHE